MSDKPSYVIVVGASAGGLNALTELVSQFNELMDASVFIVLHLSNKGISELMVLRLQQYTSLPCSIATDGEPIRKGRIYIARANTHLLVQKDFIKLGHGPEENRWRPSIDVLFRSAAVAFNSRTIGIVLTGLLNDGTSGMYAIKRSGGVAIVQDPNEAEYPDMPLAVISSMEVDYCLSLADMRPVIHALTTAPPPDEIVPPLEVTAESKIAERVATGVDNVSPLGEKTIYACPDCGGGLWHVENDAIDRYRCHIGHSYSEQDLRLKQVQSIESTLWISLRMMEERRKLLLKMASDNERKGYQRMATENKERADSLEGHISQLKNVLYLTQNSD